MRRLVDYKKKDDSIFEKRKQLRKALVNWSVYGDYETFSAWLEYYHHNILPFAGGWLEQPKWIRDAFSTLNMVYNFHYYEKDIPDMPVSTKNPFFGD